MNDDDRPWVELILGYEELEDAARVEADALLASSPRARALRDALLARERGATPRGSLPEIEGSERLLRSAAERDAERESLDALFARLGLSAPAAARNAARSIVELPARRGAPHWLRWTVPAAAAAAIAIIMWWPRPTAIAPPVPPPPGIAGLSIARTSQMRGGEAAGFRTGDTFELRFELGAPGRPIVYLIDEQGSLARLYPAGDAPLRAFAMGPAVLPPRTDDTRWAFEGDPGRETFIVASATDSALDLAALDRDAQALIGGHSEREERIAALSALLERRVGLVQAIEVEHQP